MGRVSALSRLERFKKTPGKGASLRRLMRNTGVLSNMTHMLASPDASVTGIMRGVLSARAPLMAMLIGTRAGFPGDQNSLRLAAGKH
jgi:hypothetical protein